MLAFVGLVWNRWGFMIFVSEFKWILVIWEFAIRHYILVILLKK